MSSPKTLVLQGLEAFSAEFDEEKLRQVFAEDYVEHNPAIADGLTTVLANLPGMKASNYRITLHRIFEDGDLVATHSTHERDTQRKVARQLRTQVNIRQSVLGPRVPWK